ncbi:hypothetical protein MC378_08310 [Polaribacter sp. MSW13]|uniref:Secreted protein n=1 Tax=Polaribacter marinus TaxID=2916838 RepID=A0A9X2AJL6_9FLAO|nr:hypothetical protein [Polaribacter marinus]MCI2229167.1 hypothetical protein [Polaribacter marinus]
MKQFFSKIASITLAFLVLFSTFSFTVEKHYCGDFLMDVSFVGDLDDCGMKMDAKEVVKKTNCCKDEVHKIEGQDKLQSNKIEKITFEKEQFLVAFVFSYKDLFVASTTVNNFYKDFSPPDTRLDYQVLYQTFLI